ncbi:spore germination protein [Paenibacillus amylolyticus]|nr:spore germination protein [Paenibacillus amylolyticus]
MNPTNQAFSELKKNISYVEQSLYNTDDLKQQLLLLNGVQSVLLYIDSLVDQEIIQTHVLTALHEQAHSKIYPSFTTLESRKDTDLQRGIDSLIQGKCLYIIDGYPGFTFFLPRKCMSVAQPNRKTKVLFEVPHNGFVEQLSG